MGKGWRARTCAVVVAGLLAAARVALAHDIPPATLTTVRAGPYSLVVARYAEPPRSGAELPLLVSPAPDAPVAPTAVWVVARPGLGTDATPTRAVLAPDPDAPGGFAGGVRLPVAGAWLLDLLVDGPAGPGQATLAVTAAAPHAMPVWLGWLLGLSPLAGVGGLVWWQRRYLRALEAAAGAG
ncbi:MAG TPA: hypothetical protein VKZ60_20180 [Chloroflexota bacterium]|nr:hypothetical protein [Chloroflexota bacterium]